MTVITQRVRIVAAPAPPFDGTRIVIKLDDPASLTWGMCELGLAEGRNTAIVDWGDGTRDEATDGEILHTYSSAGDYEVRISDDIQSLICSSGSSGSPFQATYALMIRKFYTNAAHLDTLRANCFTEARNLSVARFEGIGLKAIKGRAFWNCSSLIGRLDFADVSSITVNSFTGCTGLTEIHFSAANEATIKAQSSWESSHHTFGAPNATISFDL